MIQPKNTEFQTPEELGGVGIRVFKYTRTLHKWWVNLCLHIHAWFLHNKNYNMPYVSN